MSPKEPTSMIERGRGRPKGRSRRGDASERALFDAALQLFSEQGFEKTTLRQIARRAGVSPGLLYRYFPSKRAVVLALNDRLSLQYAAQMGNLAEGTWTERFLSALETSLEVLGPHRAALVAITPNLVNGASYTSPLGDLYIAPDPFLHTWAAEAPFPPEEDLNSNFQLDEGEVDVNTNGKLDTYRDPFKVWTDMEVPVTLSVEYIDDWKIYHLGQGEVHCSSNERRAIPTSRKWWE